MRSKVFLFSFLLTSFFIIFSFQACSKGGNNNKDGGAVPEKKLKTCSQSLGNTINDKCDDGKKCDCFQDCGSLVTAKNGICMAKTCLATPTTEAKNKKGEAIDTSCLGKKLTLPAGPKKATLWGPVENFGLDQETVGVKIEIFEHNKDGKLTTPIAVFEASNESQKGCKPECKGDNICFAGVCTKKKDSDDNRIGYYMAKEIPTNKLLIFRSSGPNFVTTVQYNLWIAADKVKDGKLKRRAFTISNLSKGLIPPAAGIQKIASGNGAIAGEIHDCKGDQITGAKVTVSVMAQKLAYFGAESDRPDPQLEETTKNGVYSALNIKIKNGGLITVKAAIKKGGKNFVVADFTAQLFPDAITILTTTPQYPTVK